MKREILFRGKDKNGFWRYGFYIEIPTVERKYLISENGVIPYVVDKDTVGQFTGLYDNTKWENLSKEEQDEFLSCYKDGGLTHNTRDDWKGKKIFEGDIVIIKEGYCGNPNIPCGNPYVSVVEWGKLSAGFKCLLNSDIISIEVIGNIYDNSELLISKS